MKNKIFIAGVLTVVCAFTASSYVAGQNSDTGTGNQIQQQTQKANQGEDSQIQTQTQQQSQDGGETGDQVQNQIKNQEQLQQQNQALEGKVNLEQHRSAVADFVQGLLEVAEKEEKIGQQVKVIAQQQNQSVDTTVQAMEKVQTRSKIKTFLLGSDYKNLGALRSEMVQTRNRLEQLNKLMENVQNEGDRTELQNQIQTLEQEQVKIESFIKVQEDKFSLFGWLVKLFD